MGKKAEDIKVLPGSGITERELKILSTFAIILPKMTEENKSYLLGLGEGMAIQLNRQQGGDAN